MPNSNIHKLAIKKIRFPWVSLKIKLIISLVTIIFCAINVVMIVISQKAEVVIEYVKNEHIEEGALSLRNRISAALLQSGRDIVFMATLPSVFQGVELSSIKNAMPNDENARIALASILKRAKRTYSYYDALWLMNEEGNVIAGSFPNEDLDYSITDKNELKNIFSKNTLVIADAMENAEGKILLPVYLKIIYNGKKGIIAGELQVNKLARQALYEIKRPLINAYIMSENGKIVSETDSAEAKFINSQSSSLIIPSSKPISGNTVITLNDVQKDIYYHHIPRTNLYAVIVADSTYMYKYVENIRTSIIVTGIISGVLLMISLFSFIFPLTRDIKRLSKFAEKIKQHKAAPSLNIERNDELGDLAHSLTDMVRTLTDMLEETRALTKAKSEFLAHMSHEIRTPMNAIIGMTYLALKENPDKKQKHFLIRIDRAAKNLLGIINDILDFSKLEANKMEISNAPFSVNTMLTSIYDLLEGKATEKDLVFSCSHSNDVPAIVQGDPLRLSQICINLCSNAIKFTDKGSVELYVEVQSRDKDILTLLFSIKDSGIGIDENDIKYIFDSFAQADNTAARKYEGTGLGLAISKSLTTLMGGKIWIESEKNKGSTFYFTIKSDMANVENTLPVSPAQNNIEFASLENIHILVAEDNPVNQEIIVAVLSSMGANVSLANNGGEAVALWNSVDNTYDIILMDIQMPGMDGLTATRQIRGSENPKSKDIPIIALTANAISGDKEKSLEAGMNDHATKPLNIDELHTLLTQWATVVRSRKA